MGETVILQEQGSDCLGLGGTFLSEDDQNKYDSQNSKKEDNDMRIADEPTR